MVTGGVVSAPMSGPRTTIRVAAVRSIAKLGQLTAHSVIEQVGLTGGAIWRRFASQGRGIDHLTARRMPSTRGLPRAHDLPPSLAQLRRKRSAQPSPLELSTSSPTEG